MTRAAVYARKSTDQNGVADDARAVTRQIEHAKAYTARKGWAVLDECIFVDDGGMSGAEFERRPGVQRLRAALRPRPPFQALILSEQCRLSRDTGDTLQVLKELARAGVRVFAYRDDCSRPSRPDILRPAIAERAVGLALDAWRPIGPRRDTQASSANVARKAS